MFRNAFVITYVYVSYKSFAYKKNPILQMHIIIPASHSGNCMKEKGISLITVVLYPA